MALINSGIAMHHVFAAVCCSITEDEEIILYPNEFQLKVRYIFILKRQQCLCEYVFIVFSPFHVVFQSSVAYFTLVFANSETRQLLTSHTTGEFSHSMFVRCMDKCFVASKEVFNFYEKAINKSTIFN